MAKTETWIIVKILDHTKAWSNRAMCWRDLANATKFANKNYLLPQGGRWIPWATNPNYDWSEGDLVASYR